MKRTILFFTFIILQLFQLFADDRIYRVLENSKLQVCDTNEQIIVDKGTVIIHKDGGEYYPKSFLDDENDISELIVSFQNNWVSVDMKKLELTNSEKFFYKNDTIILFIPEYYFTFVQNKNFSFILDKEPYWKKIKELWDTGKRIPYGDSDFINEFQITCIQLNNLFINLDVDSRNSYLINTIEKKANTFFVELYKDRTFYQECFYPETYLKYADLQNIKLFLEFDGDYLDIWINSKDEYMGKYCAIPIETYKEIKKLIENKKVDYSMIYYPRHADGSCDYDGSKKTAAVQTAKETPSPNVAQNKLMSVTENLKLRSGEATTSKVLTVMSAGTKVKILELGKAETIDGITSNWVKIEVQADAKDRDGNPIKAGTVGWCYGGYLK